MTNFLSREQAIEGKFLHDKNLDFKIQAQARHRLGAWASDKMSLSEEETEAYCRSVTVTSVTNPDLEALFLRIATDLQEKGIALTLHHVRKQYQYCCEDALKEERA